MIPAGALLFQPQAPRNVVLVSQRCDACVVASLRASCASAGLPVPHKIDGSFFGDLDRRHTARGQLRDSGTQKAHPHRMRPKSKEAWFLKVAVLRPDWQTSLQHHDIQGSAAKMHPCCSNRSSQISQVPMWLRQSSSEGILTRLTQALRSGAPKVFTGGCKRLQWVAVGRLRPKSQ